MTELTIAQKRQKKLEILNCLKLDKHNESHLAYWQEKTWHFLWFGGKPVAFGNTTYRVPNRVAHMMEVAHKELLKEQASVETFVIALERARLQGLDANHPGRPLATVNSQTELNRPSFFRESTTAQLYATPVPTLLKDVYHPS